MGGSALRAAVITPIEFGGKTIGAVALGNWLPYAYGPGDEDLLRRAATLLGPPVASSKRTSRLVEIAGQTATANEITRVLASSQRLDEVFEAFVSATEKLVRFDCVTLAWIDPNGSDIHSLKAGSGAGASAGGGASEHSDAAGIHTRIEYGHEGMGYISLWRWQGGGFTGQDARVLDWLGFQIPFALQYHCLHRHARRQAYRLGQLHRAQPPVASSRDPGTVARMANGHAGGRARPPACGLGRMPRPGPAGTGPIG